MLNAKLTAPIIFLGISMLISGCGNDLDCASNAAKDTALSLMKKGLQERAQSPPWTGVNPTDRSSLPLELALASPECQRGVTDPARYASSGARCAEQKWNEIVAAWASPSYTLDAIRMTANDTTTGAIECAADLHIDVPNWEGIKAPMTYKVEKTSEGKIYVTVFKLHQ